MEAGYCGGDSFEWRNVRSLKTKTERKRPRDKSRSVGLRREPKPQSFRREKSMQATGKQLGSSWEAWEEPSIAMTNKESQMHVFSRSAIAHGPSVPGS